MVFFKSFSRLLLAGLVAAFTAMGADSAPDADAAWRDLKGAKPVPNLPPEWEKTPPTDQAVIRQTLRGESERLLTLAGQARQFATTYPADPHHGAALQIAAQALMSAQRIGSPTAAKLLAELDVDRLKDAQLPPAQRLEIRMRQVQAEAEALAPKSVTEARDKFEAGARALIKDFPDEPAPWAMLLECVDQGNDAASRGKLSEIAGGKAPAPIKERATGILHRYDSLGKPIEMKFFAIDGSAVDLASMRGKVVVVQFWATWCTTCVEAMEKIAQSYDSLQKIGVEVIGINLDPDKAKVLKLLKEKGVKWPQFWEEAGNGNRLVREWGIGKLPAMWLIDRNGVLRDLEAQDDLSKKIGAMLDEAPAAPR